MNHIEKKYEKKYANKQIWSTKKWNMKLNTQTNMNHKEMRYGTKYANKEMWTTTFRCVLNLPNPRATLVRTNGVIWLDEGKKILNNPAGPNSGSRVFFFIADVEHAQKTIVNHWVDQWLTDADVLLCMTWWCISRHVTIFTKFHWLLAKPV